MGGLQVKRWLVLLLLCLLATAGPCLASTKCQATLDLRRGLPLLHISVHNPDRKAFVIELPPGTCFVPADGSSAAAYLTVPVKLNVAPGATQSADVPVLTSGYAKEGSWKPGFRQTSRSRCELLQQAWAMTQRQKPPPGVPLAVYQGALAELANAAIFNQGNVDDAILEKVRTMLSAVKPEIPVKGLLQQLVPRARELMTRTGFDSAGLSRIQEATRLVQEADQKVTDGRASEALPLVERALQVDISNATQAHYVRGRTLLELKRYSEALPEFTRSLQLFEADPKSYHARALCRQGMKDYAGALLDFDAVLRRWPGQASSYAARGLLKQEMGNRESALADFALATQLDPQFQALTNSLQQSPELAPPTPTPSVLFNNHNSGAVLNGPPLPLRVRFTTAFTLTEIQTYHWNSGQGASPGQVTLVREDDGRVFGPWQAEGAPGQGGVANAFWSVRPNLALESGTYRITVSTPGTWSFNDQSAGAGFVILRGY